MSMRACVSRRRRSGDPRWVRTRATPDYEQGKGETGALPAPQAGDPKLKRRPRAADGRGGSAMKLPVWLTVFVSGIVGGWIGGAVSQALLLPLMFHTSPRSLAAHWIWVIVIGGVCQAGITGGVLLLLLPPVSSVHVGFGTTFIAVVVGNAITIGGTLLLLHATVQSNLAAGGGVGLLPAFGLFSLLLEIVGIVVTATIISNADEGSRGDGRLDLYGGQSYLDEYRKGDQG
jgi:hypothetical protein